MVERKITRTPLQPRTNNTQKSRKLLLLFDINFMSLFSSGISYNDFWMVFLEIMRLCFGGVNRCPYEELIAYLIGLDNYL